jgi:hypothetical protein
VKERDQIQLDRMKNRRMPGDAESEKNNPTRCKLKLRNMANEAVPEGKCRRDKKTLL